MQKIPLLTLIISFVILTFSACNEIKKDESEKSELPKEEDFIAEKLKLNKKVYSINIGEKVKIYHTSNSCCPSCFPGRYEYKSIQYIGSKLEYAPSYHCEGCTVLGSYNFIGKEVGRDTIYFRSISPRENCDSINDLKDFNKFIIIVK